MTAPPSQDRETSQRLAAWLVRRRTTILTIAALLAAVCAVRTAMTYANLRSDLEELLPKRAASVAALDSLRSRMRGLRHLGIVIDTDGPENVAEANRFVDDLRKRIEGYPNQLVGAVRADLSRERQFAETYVLQLMDPKDVAKLRKAVEARRDWQVTRSMGMDLLDEDEEPPPEIPIAELRAKYEKRYGKPRKLPGDRFVSEDGRTVVLLVQASSNATSYDADRALLSRIEADIQALGFPAAYAAGMRVGFAGDVATRVEEMEGLAVDLGISGALVLLLVVGVIVLYFRSWRALPILGIPLIFGTVYAFGLVALPPLSIRHLNSNTAFLGSIVVGNGINSGIILLARFSEERRCGLALERAIERAVAGSWRPTLAAALAAATAYGSLVFTDFRGFNQFGWIGGFGMVICWAATMLLAPPLISLLGGAMTPAQKRDTPTLGQRFTAALLGWPKWVLVVTFLLSSVALLGLAKRSGDWLEYDFSKLRRRDSWESGERYWGARMDATLKTYLTPTVIMSPDGDHARAVERAVLKLRDEGGAGGLISSVRSARSVLPQQRAAALAEAKKLKKVLTPKLKADLKEADRKLVERALSPPAQKLLLAGDVPDSLVAGLRENDGRVDRNVLVFPKLSEGTWDAKRMKEFSDDLRSAANVSGVQADVTGSLLLSSDIVGAMKQDGPRATLLSLLAVLAICVFAFRSLGLSVAAVVSLFVGVLLMLGGLAWTGARLNFSNFVALPITFGIAADYSINMLKRYQADGRFDLRSALSATGGAVALCSATTIIGFGSLLVAQNRALFSFGVFAVAGEVACLATAILALPAALALRSKFAEREAAAAASGEH